MIKVRTLDDCSFVAACKQLEAMCPMPDLVIGIATGGVHVSRGLFAGVSHIVVSQQRPSTPKKQQSGIKKLMKWIPYPVLDFLRIVESRVLQTKRPKLADTVIGEKEIRSIAEARNILIVDDAVDSGATLASVLNAVKRAASTDAEVHTAALTVTTAQPVVSPDFTLYNNVLLRFPWSMDYK